MGEFGTVYTPTAQPQEADVNERAVVSCPLCRMQEFVAFRFGLLRCAGCGLVVDPAILRPGSAQAINEEAFGDGYEIARSFWVRWFQASKNRRYLANLRRAGVTGGKLLEVGVGTGSFLRAARDAGFDVEGCDLSASLCQRVQQTTGITVHNVALDQLPRAAYDVVAMHHVLEHVAAPVAFLRAARERLKPDGVLHLAVPNVACWEARLPGWNSYEPYHMLYFDAGTLGQTLQHADLDVLRRHTFEPFSAWFLAAMRTAIRSARRGEVQKGRAAGKPPAGVVEHLYRLAMVSAGLVTWPLRVLQAAIGKGDELLVVAKRNT